MNTRSILGDLKHATPYLLAGTVCFATWFRWDIGQWQILYFNSYLLHIAGGMGAVFLITSGVIMAASMQIPLRRFYVVAPVAATLALFILEWAQRAIPYRYFDILDIVTQTVGVVLAIVLVWLRENRRAKTFNKLAPAE